MSVILLWNPRLRVLVQRNLQSRANLAPPLRHFLSEESPGCVKRRSFHPAFSHFSRSVAFDSLQPHESQHARPPCPSQTPGVYSNSCPSSQWSHPAISSSIVPFSSCPQSLPASGSFPMSQLFAWGGQVLEFQLQPQSFQWTPRTDLLRMDWLDLLAVQGTLKSLLQHHSSKAPSPPAFSLS